MVSKNNLGYFIGAAIIIAGIIFILCGMNPWRAMYLLNIGISCILAKLFGYDFSYPNKVTPKGAGFWLRKVLADMFSLFVALSFVDFILPNGTDGLEEVATWLAACVLGGILFGSIDYFVHNTGIDEVEFEAKKKQRDELGEIYDRFVEEKDAERK